MYLPGMYTFMRTCMYQYFTGIRYRYLVRHASTTRYISRALKGSSLIELTTVVPGMFVSPTPIFGASKTNRGCHVAAIRP